MLISSTVHINAPPEKIWQAFVDVERWPEFAPQFQSIVRNDEGPFALGKSARVTPKGFFGSVWTITEFTDGRSFTWEADMLPGLHLLAGHSIEPDAAGANVRLWLESSGPMAGVMSLALGRIFRRNVRQEGEGMKSYCERGAP
jgi:uncharacterized protein YndB with AHSA1/START domain